MKKNDDFFNDLKGSLEEAIAFSEGKNTGAKVVVPNSVDVKSIRSKMHMSQIKFSEIFGFSVDSVKSWESKRRNPDKTSKILLKVIEYSPEVVLKAAGQPTKKAAAQPKKKTKYAAATSRTHSTKSK